MIMRSYVWFTMLSCWSFHCAMAVGGNMLTISSSAKSYLFCSCMTRLLHFRMKILMMMECACFCLSRYKITLETAKLLREDYLAQNAFTPYDKFCPFYKSVWMMRNIIHFYNLANQAVEKAAGMDGQKITCTLIKHRLGDLFYRLVSQKFEDPVEGDDTLVAKFKKLYEHLTAGFRALEDETR